MGRQICVCRFLYCALCRRLEDEVLASCTCTCLPSCNSTPLCPHHEALHTAKKHVVTRLTPPSRRVALGPRALCNVEAHRAGG